MWKVELDLVRKSLKKLPAHILRKLHIWVKQVEIIGIEEVRKIFG